ncbi:MAG: DUF3192 domain-containing protein [Endomicrobiaceae bacterium]|nr:DUF3192 domain-containing protein [Endomicrobiaceae bacterium]
MKKIVLYMLFGLGFVFTGCVATLTTWEQTVNNYVAEAPKVELGMSKQEVLDILSPTQALLKNTELRHPDKYVKDGVNVEILYFRSGWVSDGLDTDDEFTPYIFNNGKLVAVGWMSIGGPKNTSSAVPRVNVQNKTVIY